MWNFQKEISHWFRTRHPASSGGAVNKMPIRIRMRNSNFSKIFRTKLSVKENLFLPQVIGKLMNELTSIAFPFKSFIPPSSHFWFHLPTTGTSLAPRLRHFWFQHVFKLLYTELDIATALALQNHVLKRFLIPYFFRTAPLLEKAGKDIWTSLKKGLRDLSDDWKLRFI